MSIIELSRLGQDLFDFSDLKCLQTKSNYIDKFKLYKISHLTWPHPSIGGGVSINHTSSNRIELSQLGQDLFDIKQYDLTPPIDPLNHSSTQLSMHPPMGGGYLFQIINLQTELNYLD